MNINDNTLLVQSNYIIENKPRFSINALRIFYTVVAMINKNDEDFFDYKIYVKEFAEQWNIDIKSNNLYDKLKPLTDEMMKSYILIEKINNRGKRVLEAFTIFTKYKYIEGEGFFRVKINPDLKDYFLNLKKKFTQYSLKNLILLNANNASAVTMRTYELVKQYEKLGNRHLEISEYKRAVGLLEMDNTGKIIFEKYKGNNANLKQYAIIPAIQLINTCTDVLIDYNITGQGSNAVINFSIKAKKENEETSKQNDIPPEEAEEYDDFLDNNFTEEEQLIMSVVPEDVHSYDKDKLKAIYSLSASYIFSLTGIDKQIPAINNIGRFTMAIWKPTKERNCKTNNKYGYYYSCFQAWLENQKLQKQQHFD
jgi:plasmid replication initiation protein